MTGFKISAIVVIGIWVAFLAGWVMNILTITHTTAVPVTGLFILRCVGIFVAPIGAVLGYF
jgi:hypothetical protein